MWNSCDIYVIKIIQLWTNDYTWVLLNQIILWHGILFATWHVSSLTTLLNFSSLFFMWFLLPFSFFFSPFSPSYGLSLGIRSGPPWHLPFGSSLASIVFANTFHFMTISAYCFLFAFELPCLKPIWHWCLTFIYVLPSMVSCIPYSGTKRLRLSFDIFCPEIGKSFKWSIFFECKCLRLLYLWTKVFRCPCFLWILLLPTPPTPPPAPLWRLGQHLALRRAKKYAHVVRALAPLASTSTSSKIVSTLQVFHPSISFSPCPHSLIDFQPNGNLELSLDFF
jgi:hypothetical protein